MTAWNYIVIGLGLLLLVFLLWKEQRRPRRPRSTARVVATVLAVGTLVCMGLPISCRRGGINSSEKEGLLLTEGYDADSVRAFLHGHAGMKVIRYDEAGAKMGGSDDAGMIKPDEMSMDRWHVFGYGLTKEEWTALRPPSLVFHSSPVKVGLVAADWQRKLRKGEPLQVQGHWKGEGRVRLLLEGMGQVLDSAVVEGDSLFSLHTVPAQVGKGVYRFVAVTAGRTAVAAGGTAVASEGAAVARKDTLEQEDIPLEVEAGRPLKVLLLASAPDAENTFLVSWLSQEGHAVASRTLVSTDKYQQVYANMTERPLGQITSSLLGDFDLVIADALTLSGGGILPLLRRQVGEKGLGLVIRVDSAGIKEKPGMRVLLRDSVGRVEVGSRREGMGKIVLTNHTTYPMVLAGEQEQYAAYWSLLLREAAREAGSGDRDSWSWRPALPRVNLPVQFALQTGASGVPQGSIGFGGADSRLQILWGGAGSPVTVYLAEDGVLPFNWEGRYWPEAVGWQTVTTLRADTTWWYTWPAEAWRPLYRERRKRETETFIAGRGILAAEAGVASGETGVVSGKTGVASGEGSDLAGEQRAALSKGWFYALFFMSLLFLWIEKKFL